MFAKRFREFRQTWIGAAMRGPLDMASVARTSAIGGRGSGEMEEKGQTGREVLVVVACFKSAVRVGRPKAKPPDFF